MEESQYARVARTTEVPQGEMRAFEVDGVDVLVSNVGGTFYAMRNVCTHGGVPLSSGRLKGMVVECFAHRALFDLRTGKASYPAKRKILTYETATDGGWILVRRVPMEAVFPLLRFKSGLV